MSREDQRRYDRLRDREFVLSSPAWATDPQPEVVSALRIYEAGHRTGEWLSGMFTGTLTRDEQGKMVEEAVSLLNSSYDPPLTLKPAQLLRSLEPSDDMMLPAVIRGLELERGRPSHRHVTVAILETGRVLGEIQRLTRDPTKKLGHDALMKTLTDRFQAASSEIGSLSETRSELAGLKPLAGELLALYEGLVKNEAYKDKKPAQFRAIADDADKKVREAISRLPPEQR